MRSRGGGGLRPPVLGGGRVLPLADGDALLQGLPVHGTDAGREQKNFRQTACWLATCRAPEPGRALQLEPVDVVGLDLEGQPQRGGLLPARLHHRLELPQLGIQLEKRTVHLCAFSLLTELDYPWLPVRADALVLVPPPALAAAPGPRVSAGEGAADVAAEGLVERADLHVVNPPGQRGRRLGPVGELAGREMTLLDEPAFSPIFSDFYTLVC